MTVDNIELSPKAIVMYEAMSGKKYLQMDVAEDMAKLMYCSFVCSTGQKITFEVFVEMLNDKKFCAKLNNRWKHIADYMQQFKSATDNDSEETEEKEGTSLTEMVNALIFHYGIDINYVMEKMDIWEITTLYKGAGAEERATMVDKRLWAFLQLLPNIDPKKAHSFTPEKFLPFAWEQAEIKEKAENNLKSEVGRMRRTIGLNIDDILSGKVNNGEGRTDDNTGS